MFSKPEDSMKQIFNFMSYLPFVKHTKYLYVLAAFINEIVGVFRDQLNLLFLIINSCQNCTDLLKVPNFMEMINDSTRTESPDLLAEALESADEYTKEGNAGDRLKKYINKLIEINNNTILHSEKKKIDTLPFRLIAKVNVHSNISLMNTFLPALAHLKLNQNVSPSKILLNAFKVLIGHKDSKDLVSKDVFISKALPSVFDFDDVTIASKISKNIESINEKNDLFGFPINDLADSLCQEIISFMRNKENKSSYRVKIWEMIERTSFPEEKPDFTSILNTLIPLFEENDNPDEHLFFNWPNNSIPEHLEGIEAASYFLKTYQINGNSLFDIIKEGLRI